MIIGYLFTIAYIFLLAGLLGSAFLLRRKAAAALSDKNSAAYLAAMAMVIGFFVAFALLYVHPVEQLYFDENIYQGIALNILHNGNALWCQYGTAHLSSCGLNEIYHDPVEISFYLAIAFAIFGPGIATAYNMELLIGALSILLVFLLGSSMFGKRTGLASAIIFSLIPELFIWSRTQAVPDLIFMMFTILAFLAYDIYKKGKSNAAAAFFLSALGIAIYTRIEGALLIPIFILLEICAAWIGRSQKASVSRKGSLKPALLFAAFVVLMLPQAYYISYEGHSLDYGTGTLCNVQSNQTFSLSNMECNIQPNTQFFLGSYNAVSYYPAYFSAFTTAIGILGALMMIFWRKKRNGIMPLLMLGLWIIVFHLFYDFFYAGSVLYGVDVRFMLILYPAMAIFGGFAIAGISTLPERKENQRRGKGPSSKAIIASAAIFIALIAIFAVFPFYNSLGITAISPSSMPQESMPMAATSFLYNSINSVPANCLVFTFTPDIWYEYNRSAAQVGYVGSSSTDFQAFESQFSCFAFDSGYWCTTSGGGFKGSTCTPDISNYNSSVIASSPAPNGIDNFTIYKLNNYTT